MARARLATGEKPLWWVGSAKDDLLRFPEAVKDKVGTQCRTIWQEALLRKAVKGRGTKRLGSCADHRGDTYRARYTVGFEAAIYVLHAFQKKSPKGIKAAHADVNLVRQRLKIAAADYEACYGKQR
jgi:phage-related protein